MLTWKSSFPAVDSSETGSQLLVVPGPVDPFRHDTYIRALKEGHRAIDPARMHYALFLSPVDTFFFDPQV